MTFLVCLPVEVLIPVSENTEEYSVRILYLYGYTFFPLLPHWHRDLSLFHFSRNWASSQIFCRASSTQQRVKIYMFLWGKIKNCGTILCRAETQRLYQKFWIVHSQPRDKWTVPSILAGKTSSHSFSTSDLPTPVSFLTENCACLPGTVFKLLTSQSELCSLTL